MHRRVEDKPAIDPARGLSPDRLSVVNKVEQPGERLYGSFLDYYSERIFIALQGINLEAFNRAVDCILLTQGTGQIFIAGNGGSATIAEHLTQNINWDASMRIPHGQKLSARCLNSEPAEITARANDRHFAYSFASMLDNHARAGDVFIGISASGESDSIVKALAKARQVGVNTIFIGKPNSSAERIADTTIAIGSDDQQVLEDVSQAVIHMMVRALRVKLEGSDKGNLFVDIAHLRTKTRELDVLSEELGEPAEIEVRTRHEFKVALNRFVDEKVIRATQAAFPIESDSMLVEPFADDFTSFIRLVRTGAQKYLAKFSFGVTVPRLIMDGAREGILGFAEVVKTDNQSVVNEFRRSVYLHSIFPEHIPLPHQLESGVAFYAFVNGRTLEQMMLDGDRPPMVAVGRLLKNWHDFFRTQEPPVEVQSFCTGDLDRISRYQARYSTLEGLQRAFQPLFINRHLDAQSVNEALNLLAESVASINRSGVISLKRDTWGHGDFKPGNVIHSDQDEIFFIDNDLHEKSAVVDVAKMISRALALCFDRSCNPERIVEDLSEFIAGYTADWDMPPYLPEIMAVDLIGILSSYATINLAALDRSPHLAQILLRKPKDVIYFINHLTCGQHSSLDSIAEYFHRPAQLRALR